MSNFQTNFPVVPFNAYTVCLLSEKKTFPSCIAADELMAKPVLYCQARVPFVLLIPRNLPCAVPMKTEFPLTSGVDLTGASAKKLQALVSYIFSLAEIADVKCAELSLNIFAPPCCCALPAIQISAIT